MKVPKSIPSKNIDVDIKKIIIDPENRSAMIVMRLEGQRTEKSINLMPIYNMGNASQKQTIKRFIRQIVANGLEVDLSEVPDNIFN